MSITLRSQPRTTRRARDCSKPLARLLLILQKFHRQQSPRANNRASKLIECCPETLNTSRLSQFCFLKTLCGVLRGFYCGLVLGHSGDVKVSQMSFNKRFRHGLTCSPRSIHENQGKALRKFDCGRLFAHPRAGFQSGAVCIEQCHTLKCLVTIRAVASSVSALSPSLAASSVRSIVFAHFATSQLTQSQISPARYPRTQFQHRLGVP